jgi:hypothetical protein
LIYISRYYPKIKLPFAYLKLLKAYFNFFDHFTINMRNPDYLNFFKLGGYQRELSELKNKHKGERCFIIGNGPSLSKMDLSFLKDEITIGSNNIYKLFKKNSLKLDYLVFEDVEQAEIRGAEVSKLNDMSIICPLHSAHSFSFMNRILFYYIPRVKRGHSYYSEKPIYPQFSEDFAAIAHIGYTVTYIIMQLAFHLGFSEIYLIGIDHDYGQLPKLFPPGKIKITNENYELVKKCHFDENYYRIGDVIGVPWVEKQNMAYQKAREVFERNNIIIKNAGIDSKLETFDKVNLSEILN